MILVMPEPVRSLFHVTALVDDKPKIPLLIDLFIYSYICIKSYK